MKVNFGHRAGGKSAKEKRSRRRAMSNSNYLIFSSKIVKEK